MLNNHQKYFVKNLANLMRDSYNLDTKLPQEKIEEEINYLSRTYNVKFFKYMSWTSPYCIFNNVNFGRFDIKINPRDCSCLLYNPKHKHPHSWVNNIIRNEKIGNRYFDKTCFGSHIENAIYDGRLIDVYRMYNHTIKNIGPDSSITSKYSGPNIIDFCHNFKSKEYKVCESCGEGFVTDKEECTWHECCSSPYCEDEDYDEDFDEDF